MTKNDVSEDVFQYVSGTSYQHENIKTKRRGITALKPILQWSRTLHAGTKKHFLQDILPVKHSQQFEKGHAHLIGNYRRQHQSLVAVYAHYNRPQYKEQLDITDNFKPSEGIA